MVPNPVTIISNVRRSYLLRFVAVLAVIVLIVAIFGGVIYAHTGSELQSDVESQLVTGAETDADQLETWFESSEQYVESLSRTSRFRNDDRVSIADSLHRTADRPAFDGAYYVHTETGAVETSAGTDEIIADGHVRADVENRISTATDGTPEVGYTEPFETEDGRPALLAISEVPGDSEYALVGLVDLESLSEYVLRSGETDDVTVVDSGGTVVLSDDRSQLLTTSDLERSVFAAEAGTTTVDPEGGNETVVGYAPVGNDGWTLTTRVPAADAYSLQSDISNQILAMLAVVVASMVVFGATVGRNTANSLQHLSERAAAIEDGNLDEGVESDRRDELGDLHRSIDRMRRALRDRLEEAETAREEAERERERAETARKEAERARTEAEQARDASETLSRHLERTADAYGETMRACADGDLTRRLDSDAESEAMATIATEFNAMMDDIEATIASTKEFADAVDETAESTADGVVEVESAAEQVATSVQEIADGAEQQSEHLAAVNDDIGAVSATTDEIADTASEVAALAERTATTSASARESARRAIDGMNAIAADADEAVTEVDRLEDEIEAIDELLAFIRDVAEQTDLLALNANIEAARSSSNGAGFATVAQEIKALAEETKEAAGDIETRLEQVRDQSDRVATVVRETNEQILTHRDDVEESVASLEEISTNAAKTNEGVQEISTVTRQQAAATRDIATKIDDVTAISERTSAETGTVAASAQEQTASLTEVATTATSLSERARDLSTSLSSFVLSAEDAAPEATLEPDRESSTVDDSGVVLHRSER